MTTPDYARMMARYNRWMNHGIYRAAGELSDEARRRERGAFFGSIHGTLNHILWADQIWLHRFIDTPQPKAATIAGSAGQFDAFGELQKEREAFDQVIETFADELTPTWLEGDLSWYSDAVGREVSKPKSLLLTHLFNHQTHHRGQVHCMLTACGVATDATDLPFMPE